jgi:hypothetical protein
MNNKNLQHSLQPQRPFYSNLPAPKIEELRAMNGGRN